MHLVHLVDSFWNVLSIDKNKQNTILKCFILIIDLIMSYELFVTIKVYEFKIYFSLLDILHPKDLTCFR